MQPSTTALNETVHHLANQLLLRFELEAKGRNSYPDPQTPPPLAKGSVHSAVKNRRNREALWLRLPYSEIPTGD
jgi:hypothetical protein